MQTKIGGVIAAVPTPFDANGEPDAGRFIEHCEWVLANGGDGLNVLGSTGEANSQSLQSRASLMRTAAGGSFAAAGLMVGTGTPAIADTIALTRLASKLGYDAALILPPYYYKPVTDDGLFRYFESIVRAVNDIDIYLYNFPQLTGIAFTFDFIERLIETFPGRICGIKDSSGEVDNTRELAARFGDAFNVFPGSEGPLPDAAERGYAGCISASVNATVGLAAKVWRERDNVDSSDGAELRELRDAVSAVPMVPAVKQLVAMRTGDEAWLNMLPPFLPLEGEALQGIEELAERLGFDGCIDRKDRS